MIGLVRAVTLCATLAPFGTAEIVEDEVSAALWRSIRDVAPFAADDAKDVLDDAVDKVKGIFKN